MLAQVTMKVFAQLYKTTSTKPHKQNVSKQQQIASGNILSALVTKKTGKPMQFIINNTLLTVEVCKQQQIASGNLSKQLIHISNESWHTYVHKTIPITKQQLIASGNIFLGV